MSPDAKAFRTLTLLRRFERERNMAAVVANMRPIRMRQHGTEGIVDNAIWAANVGSLEVSHQRESVARWSLQICCFCKRQEVPVKQKWHAEVPGSCDRWIADAGSWRRLCPLCHAGDRTQDAQSNIADCISKGPCWRARNRQVRLAPSIERAAGW